MTGHNNLLPNDNILIGREAIEASKQSKITPESSCRWLRIFQ